MRRQIFFGFIASCVLIIQLLGCSATSSSDDAKLRSEARAALSLAAESKLFIDYVTQDDVTDRFTTAYVHSLQRQADDLMARLNRLKVLSTSKESLGECMKQTVALRSVLSSPDLISEDHELLISIRTRVVEIEASLKKTAKPE